MKTEIVECGAIQHNAKSEVFTISYFRLSQLTLLNLIQQKPSPFELIAPLPGSWTRIESLITTV